MEVGHCFIARDVAWASLMVVRIQTRGLDLCGMDLMGISFGMEGRMAREYSSACSDLCQPMSKEI